MAKPVEKKINPFMLHKNCTFKNLAYLIFTKPNKNYRVRSTKEWNGKEGGEWEGGQKFSLTFHI